MSISNLFSIAVLSVVVVDSEVDFRVDFGVDFGVDLDADSDTEAAFVFACDVEVVGIDMVFGDCAGFDIDTFTGMDAFDMEVAFGSGPVRVTLGGILVVVGVVVGAEESSETSRSPRVVIADTGISSLGFLSSRRSIWS